MSMLYRVHVILPLFSLKMLLEHKYTVNLLDSNGCRQYFKNRKSIQNTNLLANLQDKYYLHTYYKSNNVKNRGCSGVNDYDTNS